MTEEIKNWTIEKVVGEGRGNPFWNTPSEYVHEETGLKITGHDGYEDDDDEDWDDFGYPFYWFTCTGTEQQLKDFLEQECNGDEEYEEDTE